MKPLRTGRGKRLIDRINEESARRYHVVLQMSFDAAVLAINGVFHAGPKKAGEFRDAYTAALGEIMQLFCEDARSDRSMEYSKAKLDEALRRIVGDKNFAPWDERYGRAT